MYHGLIVPERIAERVCTEYLRVCTRLYYSAEPFHCNISSVGVAAACNGKMHTTLMSTTVCLLRRLLMTSKLGYVESLPRQISLKKPAADNICLLASVAYFSLQLMPFCTHKCPLLIQSISLSRRNPCNNATMPRANLLVINHNNQEYTCNPCNSRGFNSANGALSHARDAGVHQGEWCKRCEWLFVSPAARDAHAANSSKHNICNRCSRDVSSFQRLETHKSDVHHECSDCGREFQNDNNLQQV